MNIGERIKKAREARGLTLRYVAEKLGKTEATVQRYESGTIKIKNDLLTDIAEILSVNPAYLMGWTNDDSSVSNFEYGYVDTAVAAGELSTVEAFTSNNIDKISLPNAIMGRYAASTDIFVTRVNGESMNNVIPDKSLIAVKLIESALDLENGDIVVFRNGSGLSVKRFYNDTTEKRLVFRPDSSDNSFIDQVVNYEEAEDLQIYGKVVVYVVQL